VSGEGENKLEGFCIIILRALTLPYCRVENGNKINVQAIDGKLPDIHTPQALDIPGL
jgi:hypothetical protein